MFWTKWHRPLSANVTPILVNSWSMVMGMIGVGWLGIHFGQYSLGDGVTSSLISGVSGWSGLVIGIAKRFATTAEENAKNTEFLPNVHLAITLTSITFAALMGMAVYAIALGQSALDDTILSALMGVGFAMTGGYMGVAMDFAPEPKKEE